MKEKIKNIWKKPITPYILLAVVIVLQMVVLSCNIIFCKDGFHSDEIYSYGLSNSYHNPFLVDSDYIFESEPTYYNVHEWVSGDVFHDYITVNEGQTFDYENVWFNQSLDRHPPLYYAVLHTICSFFPEQFTPWFGFGLNLAIFVVVQIFLFLLARKVLKSNALALLTVICYGFSIGAISTFIYIRMYTMVTMWIIILAYLHAKLLENKDKLKIKSLIPITIIVMLGALTQHEFTVIAFLFAVCFCLYYLFKKQLKNFFKYGCSMLLGVLLAWAIFTPLMSQIFVESGDPLDWATFLKQLNIALYYPLISLFGICQPTPGTWVFLGIMIPTILGVIIVFAIPICFLLKDNRKFIALKDGVKNSGKKFIGFIKGIRPQKIVQGIKGFKRINILCLSMLVAVVGLIAAAARTAVFWKMSYCDRYVFVIYPFTMLVSIALIYWLVRKIRLKPFVRFGQQIVAVVFVFLLLYNVTHIKSEYYFEGANNIGDLSEITADCDCIIVDYTEWRMECFSFALRNVDQAFYTTYYNLEEKHNAMDTLKTSKTVYLFLLNDSASLDGETVGSCSIYDENTGETAELSEAEILEKYFSDLNYYTEAERIGVVAIFAHMYSVYQLN